LREKKAKRGFAAQELVEAYEQIWEAMKAKVSPQEQETWKWHYETGKVLIIEDMPTWQSVLKEIVEAKAGESYELAMNQETAKSLLTDHHYKLILLNLNLSIGDLDSGIGYEGLDILDFLKANDQDTPVLLLSSNPLINRDIFDKYPNVKNFFFKGTGGSLVKSLSENIRKYLDD
jgi:CheY-like chemotaxis protein